METEGASSGHSLMASKNWKEGKTEGNLETILFKRPDTTVPLVRLVVCTSPVLLLAEIIILTFIPSLLSTVPAREKTRSVRPDVQEKRLLRIPTTRKLLTVSGHADKQKPQTQTSIQIFISKQMSTSVQQALHRLRLQKQNLSHS